MSRLCTPYHIAYLVRAAESYGCIPITRRINDVIRQVAEANWEWANGSHYLEEKQFVAFLQYVSQCRDALDAMPVMEEDARPVLTIAACHWYQAHSAESGVQAKRLVDSIIVAASYQLPCMEEECGIL